MVVAARPGFRRPAWWAVLPAVLVLAAAVLVARAGGPDGGGPVRGGPWFGVVRPGDGAGLRRLAEGGPARAVVALDWGRGEPVPGRADTAYLARAAARVERLRAAGVGAVLDPGLQHPPAWVFRLPGGTRFRDQYGVAWRGSPSAGTAVADAVFDPHVRAAEAGYLRLLASGPLRGRFAAVRVGGLLSGELRLPPAADGAGHRDALWASDASARRTSPVPGWRPGAGDRAADARGVRWYLDALTGYERWLLRAASAAFPRARPEVLLPGWGLRPGQVAAAVDGGLDGGSRAERGGMLAAGLDWARQVPVLAAARPRAVAYTTWLDAPAAGGTPQLVAPVDYLASLARVSGVAVAGENTRLKPGGPPAASVLRTCLGRVRRLRLAGMMWMGAPDPAPGPGAVTPDRYARAVARGRPWPGRGAVRGAGGR